MLQKIIYFFCLICLCIPHFDANALTCPETNDKDICEATFGCFLSAIGCKECSPGTYFDSSSKTCKSCPSGHPNSVAGSIGGISDCYKLCETKTIQGGKRVPSSDKAYYNTQCAYTTQCENWGAATNCSNMGFHPYDETCVPNVESCSSNSFKFYNGTGFSECYVSSSSCGTNERLVQQENYSCNGTPYGICMTNSVRCDSAPGLNTSACNGTVSGDAQLSGGTYDFSSCKCKKGQPESNDTNTGYVVKTCSFSSNGSSVSTNCTNELTSCNDGYCSRDNSTCVSIPDNYYKDGVKDCKSCPSGSYRSGSETTCYWDSRTRFSDGNGSFTIPASGKIIAK